MIKHHERADGVDIRLQEWLDLADRDLPFDLVITAGVRTASEQERLYAQGRTAPGPIVTHAQPEQSAHCHGGAVDVAPLAAGGIPWKPTDPGWDLWAKLGEHAMMHGLTWGGCHVGGWAHFVDMPHVEVPDWQELPLVA